jgi:hypothetical protein
MPTLTKSDQRAPNEQSATTIAPLPPNSPPLRKNLATGERLSVPTVAPMSRRRIFAATEGPCRGEGCAKLLTLRIADNCSRGFYFGGPVPASGLAASILADFGVALPARIDAAAANAATPLRLIQETILHYFE